MKLFRSSQRKLLDALLEHEKVPDKIIEEYNVMDHFKDLMSISRNKGTKAQLTWVYSTIVKQSPNKLAYFIDRMREYIEDPEKKDTPKNNSIFRKKPQSYIRTPISEESNEEILNEIDINRWRDYKDIVCGMILADLHDISLRDVLIKIAHECPPTWDMVKTVETIIDEQDLEINATFEMAVA